MKVFIFICVYLCVRVFMLCAYLYLHLSQVHTLVSAQLSCNSRVGEHIIKVSFHFALAYLWHATRNLTLMSILIFYATATASALASASATSTMWFKQRQTDIFVFRAKVVAV